MSGKPHLCSLGLKCPVLVPARRLACAYHWDLVPPAVQQRVLKAWDALGHTLVDAPRPEAFEFIEAVRVAREHCRAKEVARG